MSDQPHQITERGAPEDRIANQRELEKLQPTHLSGQTPAVLPTGMGVSLDDIARMGMWLHAAEKGTDAKSQAMAAALRIAYAVHMGYDPHVSSEVYLIRGNLVLSAKLCRARAHEHGLRVMRVEETEDSCTAAVVADNGIELGRTTYTLAMAQKAGLKGDNWTKNPDRMLWARASKRALDDHAPWVTVGIRTPEEFDDTGQEVLPFEDAD